MFRDRDRGEVTEKEKAVNYRLFGMKPKVELGKRAQYFEIYLQT